MSALAKKLLIKPGRSVLLLNAPDGCAESLGPLPDGARILADQAEKADVVLLFARDSGALERHAGSALHAVQRDGVLWICYLKGGVRAGTDLNRDVLHATVQRSYGWIGVSLVAVDERWSAMRFRSGEPATS